MSDYLRPNEFDGIGNISQIRAIGFAEWIQKTGWWFVKNKTHQWFNSKGKLETTEDLYKEYLKTLQT